MLGNGMIIQRDTIFPIWTLEKIFISFNEKNYESEEKDGKYLILLDPIPAGGPFTMEITSIKNGKEKTKIISDLYSGDLWLCAGQSNMEMTMERLKDNFSEEWDMLGSSDFPLIRQFKVNQEYDFAGPREFMPKGNWLQASPETLNDFTAVGWFFAKNLYKKYLETERQTVPIGLIATAWGGTPIESWMSREALKDYPFIIKDGDQYKEKGKIEEITNNTNYAILEWESNVKEEDVGFVLGWDKSETDITNWDEITLPGNFYENSKKIDTKKMDEELKNFCGSIWLAMDFEVSEDFVKSAKDNAEVWLGTIVDADTVYLNGKEIGSTGYRYPPRKYNAKELIKTGKNRIVIRVVCNSGQGMVTPGNPLKIFTYQKDKNKGPLEIQLEGIWKYKIGSIAPGERPAEFFFQWQPMGPFNAMIAPLLKYPLKGVIWYQGESNESRPNEYADLFKNMILDWRKKNLNDKLPFLFVQLPIFLEPSENNLDHNWAKIREAQSTALSLPYTGMAAAWEYGEWNDIHPINKKDVGYRLYLAAEKVLWGVENTSPGPMVDRWEIKDGKVYIYFKNYGVKITSRSTFALFECKDDAASPLRSCEAYAKEKRENNFIIEGKDCISIEISSLKDPKMILYAWANNPIERSLYNSEGLPVLPFKIQISANSC